MSNRRFSGRLAVAAGLVTAGFVLTACGSSTASNGSGGSATGTPAASSSTDYAAEVAKYEGAVTAFTGPTSGPAAATGKKLMILSCAQAAEGCALPAKAAVEAAQQLGWTATIFDGQGNPDLYNRAITQAIAEKADGILMIAVSDELVADSVAKARAAGIAVFSQDSGNVPSDTGVQFENSGQLDQQAQALAAKIIKETDSQAKVLLMWDREFKSVLAFNEAFKTAMAACSTCEIVSEQDFVVTDLQDKLPQKVVSTLKANPQINVLVNWDAANLFTVPAMKSAGLSDKVKVGSFNGISPAIALVRSGDLLGTVGQAMEWAAWASVDNFNRVFAGEKPVDQNVPMRLITSNNVAEVPTGEAWSGDIDFRAAYKQLWGK